MPFLYPIVSDITASLNSGSFLNKVDYTLFVSGSQPDLWFSTSDKDSIEISFYDLEKNLSSWRSDNNLGEYKQFTANYCNSKNNSVPYEYKQFVFNSPIYKTEKILLNPLTDVSASNLPIGNYILSYQFTRYLAGTPTNPLLIKEISPSKMELKLIPSKNSTIEYQAFCLNKIPLSDVSPLYLKLTKNCVYEEIFALSRKGNESAVSLVKNLFFIPTDGKFVEFLKDLYEDLLKYSVADDNLSSYKRTQGIRTYFNNFLISNTDKIYNFDEIKAQYEKFVSDRLEVLFVNFKSLQYISAKKYLFDVFVKHFFDPIHDFLHLKYEEKYRGPLKNSLCFGIGQYIPIINASYIDERTNSSDPLTLIVKLQHPLVDNVSIKSSVWVSNTGMKPFFFNAIIEKNSVGKTFRIANPDFTIIPEDVSFSNSDSYYTNEDLTNESVNENNVDVSKKINELNIDYSSSLSNFVVFSSAELRHSIFKNKMISLAGISSSLSTIDTNYSSSGYTYPYYLSEKSDLQVQKTNVIDSFDGWESYLYKTGDYEYSPNNRSFANDTSVEAMNEEVLRYDKYNRDSLINNTPEHIIQDVENDDYLIFLSMIGHYFDNLYLYIRSLPSQRSTENSNTFSRNALQQMLQSFGWKLDASLESLNIGENYLDRSLSGTNVFSSEERTRQVWNRILNTLPLIYKTKGTEECIRLVLSCYGIPSTLLNIREYGGVDYTVGDKTSYSTEEKIFMLIFKGYREYITLPFDPLLKTIEFKVSLNQTRDWKFYEKIPLAVKYNKYNQPDWTIGVYKEPKKHVGRAYFQLDYPTYEIGVIGDYGIVNIPNTQSYSVARYLTESKPDFVITTGDNTYEGTTGSYDRTAGRLYQQFMYPYTGVSGSGADINRFFPTIGDRDYISGSYTFYQSFFITTPRFYTFKKGNVQFFMLNSDTNEPSGSTTSSLQSTWFRQEITSSLNDVDILWRIACFHHPNITSITSTYGTSSNMNWGFASMGIDVCMSGHQHVYERLEHENIPYITNGIGGADLHNFTTISAQSKFRYSASHGYSVITTKGNSLSIALYDMYGNFVPDTGTTSLPSSSIQNGVFALSKSYVSFSDRPFRQSDKYILSDPMPLFNGELFNIMVRKNDPDELFEYNLVNDLIPTKYDLWVQRKDDSRTIFSSSVSDIFTQTYNYKFSNQGTIYFGNYENSSSFTGQLDKILVWDTPISDDTYNDHCNNINSYSYIGSSVPHDALYFRMNFDYPQDIARSNPCRIINQNETFSSSMWADAYNFGIISNSSSVDSCTNTSHSSYPFQFKEISYNQTFTITSYGPNKFKNQKIQKTNLVLESRLDADARSTYSPNKFISPDSNQIGLFADPNDYKNKDIFRYLGDYGVTELVADPSQMFDEKYQALKNVRESYNDSGNKRVYYNEMQTLYKFYFDKSIFETVKQLIPSRNTILTGVLIEPTVLERPKYQYKRISSQGLDFEFTSSFIPSNITSSENVRVPSLTMNDAIRSSGEPTGEFISVDFRSSKDQFATGLYEHVPFFFPEGPYQANDPLYLEFLSLGGKLKYVESGWIEKYPDVGEIGNVEQHDWAVPAIDFGPLGPPRGMSFNFNPFFNNQIALPGFYLTGSGYYYLRNCHFYVRTNTKVQNNLANLQKNIVADIDFSDQKLVTIDYPSTFTSRTIKDIENPDELGIQCDDTGKIIETMLTGSIPRYIIKSWKKDNTFVRKGEFTKPQTVESQSIFLYTTQPWNIDAYENIIYTSSVNILVSRAVISQQSPNVVDYSPVADETFTGWVFTHEAGTFKQRPNTKINNIYGLFDLSDPDHRVILEGGLGGYKGVDWDQYLEFFRGYSRNHLTHKRSFFSKEIVPMISSFQIASSLMEFSYNRYKKSSQTIDTTVDSNGFDDKTLPIQSVNVSNVNVVKTDNVLS